MRIKSVKISGYRAIPFCATFNDDERSPEVIWEEENQFYVSFPDTSPYISAIIGQNSCGKSTIVYALQYFFSNTTKLVSDEFYNEKNSDRPIIIEVVLKGTIPNPEQWHAIHCHNGEECSITLLSITSKDSRKSFIRLPNGQLKKVVTQDKNFIELLLPKFRMIPADCKLADEVNPEKKNLVTDLIEELIVATPGTSNRSVLKKLDKAITELERLVHRDQLVNGASWKEIEVLENMISYGLADLTPGGPKVRFSINENIPTLQNILLKGKFRVIDGIELGFEGHGLGLQRTFLVSVLNAWANTIGHKKENQDYVFAIEEPELYLHPHAIRVLLQTLENISRKDQVIFTSHVGEFVNSVPIDNVIRINRFENLRTVILPDLTILSASEKTKVQRYLHEDRSDMLFSRAVLLVEGQSELFAIPQFAAKLGVDFNRKGISVVFVNGSRNFPTYHHILNAFRIPHIILADGDGNQQTVLRRISTLADHVFVLERDFEFLIASVLDDSRILLMINQCRKLKGEKRLNALDSTGITAEQLKASWLDKLNEDINGDISKEHRRHYDPYKSQLNQVLVNLANEIANNNHFLPSATIERRAKLIKNQTKPLAGRVLGEQLKKSEILLMNEICDAIRLVSQLAG